MNNAELRNNIIKLFSEDFELDEPLYGETIIECQAMANSAMHEEFSALKAVMDKFFPNMTVEGVDHYGGEGKGEEYWTVVKFECEGATQLVRFEGYYQSHYGTDFNDWNFVKPVEVTITAYEIN